MTTRAWVLFFGGLAICSMMVSVVFELIGEGSFARWVLGTAFAAMYGFIAVMAAIDPDEGLLARWWRGRQLPQVRVVRCRLSDQHLVAGDNFLEGTRELAGDL